MNDIKIGGNIGVLTILEEIKENGCIKYKTLCECGNIKIIPKSNLIKWYYKKCSCVRKNKGGLSYSPLYSIWRAMINRCNNFKSHGYKYYGAKGIKVCEQWENEINGYINFYNWSIKNGYKQETLKSGKNKYTLDRIDSSKGYSPNNCRWVDYETQITNIKKLCTNTSGYIGVSWSKQEQKWVSIISIHNHSKRIGSFKTQKEAVEARNNFIETHNLTHQKNIYIGELNK